MLVHWPLTTFTFLPFPTLPHFIGGSYLFKAELPARLVVLARAAWEPVVLEERARQAQAAVAAHIQVVQSE